MGLLYLYLYQSIRINNVNLHELSAKYDAVMIGSNTLINDDQWIVFWIIQKFPSTVIPLLTKIIRSGITFVSRNVISRRFL